MTNNDIYDIARSYSEAVNDRDWDRLRNQVLAPDVEAWSQSSQFLERGPDEIVAALQKTSGLLDNVQIEVMNSVIGDDQAVLELRLSGTTRDSNGTPSGSTTIEPGVPVFLNTCHVYRVRDGKIVHVTTYSDRTFRRQA